MSSEFELSIVIVNYHAWDKLEACLKSLQSEFHPDIRYQVIVVNNDPNDQTPDAFYALFPFVLFVNNTANNGFAHGCNTGALLAEGEAVLFLNPDTVVPSNSLRPMLKTLLTLPDFSVVGCQKRNKKAGLERVELYFPTIFSASGIGKSVDRLIRKIKGVELKKHDNLLYPDWISGCVVLIRKADLQQLNGWETRFWMYSEDVDLCKRAVDRGGNVVVLTDVYIQHDHGGSSRINPQITALTKTEVMISHHVFVMLHMKGLRRYLMHCQFAFFHMFATTFWAFISIFFFNHPKAKAKRLLLGNLTRYYFGCIKTGKWLSSRSVGKETRFLITDENSNS